eukprot:TRINITY_DN2078_c0_g1_i2.p1 TRINITY_DN2078_c0_g1~~TRINITY_DN2078_c0_g1_i2.p1  ORF type:complete len:440 (+),score=104.09 TRINITY_DN2078_c0_g1_i2:45-1364(+)
MFFTLFYKYFRYHLCFLLLFSFHSFFFSFFFFFFKQKTAYEMLRSLVGSEMCIRDRYHTMMTGKDDLTKATQLGFRIGQYLPYGRYKMSELGIDDGIRHSGKSDVIDTFPKPHEAYGYFLNNQTVLTEAGANISAFEAHYACLKNNPSKCDRLSYPDRLYEDNWVAQNALELLDRKPRDTPWFMHVSFPGPHPAFLVTARMADTVGNRTWPQPVDTKKKDTCRNKPHEPANGNRCNYGAEIENLDRLFGMVVSKVESLGELEDTIVCISSDHGEMLGDHGGWAKSKPWEASASVPLLCWGEKFGIVANATISTPVSTLDLAGTFMDYGGAKPAPGMTTASLRPMLVGSEAPVRSFISSGLQNWRMAVQNVNGTNFKFICCKGSCPNPPSNVGKPKHGWTQLLYAIEQDQFDMNELSGKHPDVVETMRPLLPASFGCGKK